MSGLHQECPTAEGLTERGSHVPNKDVHKPHTGPGAKETLSWELAWDPK